jgi:serine/threonine-protein kinase
MRTDLQRALAGQRVEATPVMGDAEKTAIIGGPVTSAYGTPYGPGYRRDDDEEWNDEEERARQRRKRIIVIASVLGVLLIGGLITAFALLGGGDEEPTTPTVQQVAVPALIGEPQADAERAIEDAGLVVGDVTPRATQDDAQVGTVLETTPASGAQVDEGTEVDLVVGTAPDTIAVPNVVGLSEDRARGTLEEAGFTSINSRQVDSLEDEGSVVAVDPAEGSQADPATPITLEVSTGTIPLPDVTGQQEAAATEALAGAGLTNVTSETVDSDQPAGTVIGTDPAPGNGVGADTRITLQVSGGPPEPETKPIPNVTGANPLAAEGTLAGAGFTNIEFVDEQGNPVEPVGAGPVLRTNPTAGTPTELDSLIQIVVGPPPGG